MLVVGGAGYVGSHMVLSLLDAGHHVEVVDDLSRGFADAVPPSVPLHRIDILDTQALSECLFKARADVVMHFAALAYVGESVSDPARYGRTNVQGSWSLLEAMRQKGPTRLVFSSTCATYGDPQRLPIDEHHPQVPVNPYGRSKLAVEWMLQDYARAYGFASISLRYFNAAGADRRGRARERHDPETHLIPLVLDEAARILQGGAPSRTRLAIFGDDFPTADGTCVRDYIHVEDLCKAHLLAAERLLQAGRPNAEAYNLGNGRGSSVREVIQACREVTGVAVEAEIQPRREGDPAELVADATRAGSDLGWRPEICALRDIIVTAWAQHPANPSKAAA